MQVGHGEKAKQLFMEGYNCSQAVLGAFCEECGLDFDTAMKMSSSFGGGMGRLREVCGAVSGMFMVAGLIYGPGGAGDKIGFFFRSRHGKVKTQALFAACSFG